MKLSKIKLIKRFEEKENCYDIQVDEVGRYYSNGILSHNSSIIMGIVYAIYGKTLTKVDSIVNWTTKKNCKVELCFSLGKDEYCILRYRQHETHGNKTYLFKNKKDISFKNIGDTEQLIQDIVQINYDVFKSSIVLNPEIYTSFLRAKNSDRLKVIENIFTLGFINEYASVLKELRKPILNNIQKIKTDREKAVSVFETIETTIKSYRENALKTLSAIKADRERCREDLKKLNKDLEELKEIDVEKERALLEIEKSNSLIEDRIKEAEKELVDVNSLIVEKDKLDIKYKKLSTVNIIEERDNIKNYEKIVSLNKEIEISLSKIENSIREALSIRKDIERKEKELGLVQNEIDSIKEHMEICSQCKQKVDISFNVGLIEEKEVSIKTIEERIERLTAELAEYNIEELTSQKEALTKTLKTTPPKPNFSNEELNKLTESINEVSKNIEILSMRIEDGLKNNIKAENILNDLSKKIVQIVHSEYTEDFLNNLDQEKEAKVKEISNKEQEIEILEQKALTVYSKEYVAELEEKKDKASKIIEKISKKLENEYEEDKHFEVLNQLLSNKDTGFKKYVIDKLLPIFNKHINFYITFFFNKEIALNFDKELNPCLKVNKVDTEIESFSSGMKTRLELSIMFALFMMVKTFFSSSVNIMFLDEILDMHLDDEGVQGVFNIINNLAKTNNIFIISHRDLYKDRIKNKIELEMVDETTRVVSK